MQRFGSGDDVGEEAETDFGVQCTRTWRLSLLPTLTLRADCGLAGPERNVAQRRPFPFIPSAIGPFLRTPSPPARIMDRDAHTHTQTQAQSSHGVADLEQQDTGRTDGGMLSASASVPLPVPVRAVCVLAIALLLLSVAGWTRVGADGGGGSGAHSAIAFPSAAHPSRSAVVSAGHLDAAHSFRLYTPSSLAATGVPIKAPRPSASAVPSAPRCNSRGPTSVHSDRSIPRTTRPSYESSPSPSDRSADTTTSQGRSLPTPNPHNQLPSTTR